MLRVRDNAGRVVRLVVREVERWMRKSERPIEVVELVNPREKEVADFSRLQSCIQAPPQCTPSSHDEIAKIHDTRRARFHRNRLQVMARLGS